MESIPCKTCNTPASERCGDCNLIYYCSRTCQRSDWKRHKPECKKKKKVIDRINTASEEIVNHCLDQIKQCSLCTKNLNDSKLICNSCKLVGYCSSECQENHKSAHQRECDLEKLKPIITIEIAKMFYLERTDHPDPEIIEAIDATISGIKSGTRGEHEQVHLVRSIIGQHVELTQSSPIEFRRSQEYMRTQYEDFIAGRRGL